MFGKKETSPARTPNGSMNPSGHSLNSIVAGTSINGEITADSDLRVDGTVEGTINCSAKIIIGPTGSVKGTVTCENAVIEGALEGVLQVNGLLDIREKATLNGEVTTQKLVVAAGAAFNVECTMGGSGKKSGPSTGSQSSSAAAKKPATNS